MPRKAHGLCSVHYGRDLRYGDPLAVPPRRSPAPPKVCSIDGCDRLVQGRGWCSTHYGRWRRTGDPQSDVPHAHERIVHSCAVDGCHRAARASGPWCKMHQLRVDKHGTPGPPHPMGKRWNR